MIQNLGPTSATTIAATNSSSINTTNCGPGTVGEGGAANGVNANNGRVGASIGVSNSYSINMLCRICMCDSRQDGRLLESLSRTTVESRTLHSMLMAICTPISLGSNDGMPDKICIGCKGKLIQAFKLYEMCIKSDERFRRILHSQSTSDVQIKQEIEDEDDAELINMELFYNAQVKREDAFEHGFFFGDDLYSALAAAAAMHNTPTVNTHNGPDFYPHVPDRNLNTPPRPIFECEKFVKVTPKGHTCTLCGRDFKYFSYFKQHALAQHDPTKPHKCERCKYTFKSQQRLFIHMRTHLESEDAPPLAMESADVPEPEIELENDQNQSDEAINEEELEDCNISTNPETGDKIYTCLICQKQLSTLPLYRRHRTVHTVRGRPFECDICHYRFAMKFSYNAHMQRHEEGKDPAQAATFKCNECNEIFPRRKLLNLHVATEHEKYSTLLNKSAPTPLFTSTLEEGRHGHVCPICSETFNRESVLNNHMKTHELQAAQLKHSEICFVCTVCGMECETREIFDNHITTHGDVQFENNTNVPEIESDDEHAQNGEDPLSTPLKPETKSGVKCELCSKTFPYACNLKQHKIIHHSELKPHECSICHYRFEYEGTLLRHMQKHSKSEQNTAITTAAVLSSPDDTIVAPPGASLLYKCKLCSARFQKQKSMQWHLKTHRSILATMDSTSVHELEQSLHSPGASGSSKPRRSESPTTPPPKSPNSQSSKDSSPSTNVSVSLSDQKQLQKKLYKCGFCPQKLDSEEAYHQHLRGHRVRKQPVDPLQPDNDVPTTKKKRSWIRSGEHHRCNLCHKVFTFRSQLLQHTSLHHQPGKPYECEKCHYSFVHKLNLKRHELTHLEEERLASEEDSSIQLLEDEDFNADLDELVEPVLDESVEPIAPLPTNSSAEDSEPQSGDGGGGKRNKCVVCSAIFQREDQLIEHLKTHIERIKVSKQETQTAKKILTDDNDRKCKLCHKIFKFSCQLKQHIQMHHSKDKPFECNICRYRFEFKGHMIRHKAINHAEEVAAEEAEMDELPTKITTPTVNPDGSEVYQCPVCPMNFIKQRSLTWHLKTHSGRKPKREREDSYPSTSTGEISQCRICSRTFRDVYELKAHMVTHAGNSGSATVSAPIEAEHSLFGSGLDLMLQDFPDAMENQDPLFDESNLELVLEDGFGSDDLEFNMRYQDTPPLPPAKRSLPANDSSVYDVAEPGGSSTATKGKIICELCKKDFLYSCNLKQHMQLHHAKEKPFECKICFYRFEYSGHLVRHIRQNHDSQGEEAAGENAERNFVCTFCSELFEQKSQLNSHLQTFHRGEKQFKCEFCPASFAYKKSYDTHREEHLSNKRADPTITATTTSTSAGTTATSFSCNFCKKTFASAQKVDNHVCFQ